MSYLRPNSTKAAVLVEINQPLQIRELLLPSLQFGQVLVKMSYSGLCRSQLMEIQGGRGHDRWLPHLLGHEGSGGVIEVGPGVNKVRVGDPVILTWIKADGCNASGPKYIMKDDGLTTVNAGGIATLSEYAIVSEDRLIKKPAGMPMDVAILFGCALPTGAGMVFNESKIQPTSKVLVLGLGGVGLSALLATLALDPELVIAVDISPEKIQLAREWGVVHAFSYLDPMLNNKIYSICPDGVDVCVESCGTIESIEAGYKFIKKFGGQLIFASHPPEGNFIKINPHDLISGKQISGSWGGACKPEIDIPNFYKIFSNRESLLKSFLSRKYSLDEVNVACNDLLNGYVRRPLIAFGDFLD